MGGKNSTFDRRNSIERRTQRRVLQNVKIKLQKIEKELKKFTGLPGDDNYNRVKDELLSLHQEASKKVSTFQPKNRVTGNELLKEIEQKLQLLEQLAKGNLEQREKKTEGRNEDEKKGAGEQEQRQTVELRVMQICPEAPQGYENKSGAKSPEETRRSIQKLGIPVLPNAAQDLERRVSRDQQLEISAIRKKVEDLELDISKFIGTKNGKHYNRLRSHLLVLHDALRSIRSQDEETAEQRGLCVKYVESCLSFLDEKAVDGVEESSGEEEEQLQQPVDENENQLARRMAATQV